MVDCNFELPAHWAASVALLQVVDKLPRKTIVVDSSLWAPGHNAFTLVLSTINGDTLSFKLKEQDEF